MDVVETAVCLSAPTHQVDPIFPARTAVLAGVVSVFPHWKVEEVPSVAVCLQAPTHPVDPMVPAGTSVLAGVVSVFPHWKVEATWP